ncbi:MAG: hypothetical protein WC916_06975 [Candidatus Woesearchaeota archaeon]
MTHTRMGPSKNKRTYSALKRYLVDEILNNPHDGVNYVGIKQADKTSLVPEVLVLLAEGKEDTARVVDEIEKISAQYEGDKKPFKLVVTSDADYLVNHRKEFNAFTPIYKSNYSKKYKSPLRRVI